MRVFSNISYRNIDLKTAISKIRGIHAVLAAIKKFPAERLVVKAGLVTLDKFSFDHEGNAKILVTELNVVPLVIESMNAFLADEEIVRHLTNTHH